MGRLPKVAELHKGHALPRHDEGVLGLEVSVDDAFAVAVLQGDDQLHQQQMLSANCVHLACIVEIYHVETQHLLAKAHQQ